MSLKRPLAFTVSAPGKVILHGEHSVVYGKTALAASLNLRTNVTLKETGSLNGSISIDLPNIELQHVYSCLELNGFLSATPPLLEGRTRADFNLSTPELIDSGAFIKTIKEYVKKSLDAASLPFAQESALVAFLYITTGMFCSVNFQLRPFSIQGVTDLAIGSGAGSSASFAVCLSAALIHYIRSMVTMNGITHNNISKNGYKSMELKVSDLASFNKFEKDLICRWALASEKIMHGNPSGLDNSICTFGSVIKYKKGFDGESSLMEPIPHVSGLKILLVNSGVQRDTVAMVEKVAARYKTHPRVMVPLLDAMDGIAQEATLILEQMKDVGDTSKQQNELHKKLEELVDMNQALLSAIGVSHPKLDQICSIVTECGLHAKLTGAGGGGFAFVLLPPEDRDNDSVRKVKEQLTNKGFLFNETELGGSGITVQNLCSSF